jgi:hypothetical protein
MEKNHLKCATNNETPSGCFPRDTVQVQECKTGIKKQR